jgi:hypothetical protein
MIVDERHASRAGPGSRGARYYGSLSSSEEVQVAMLWLTHSEGAPHVTLPEKGVQLVTSNWRGKASYPDRLVAAAQTIFV